MRFMAIIYLIAASRRSSTVWPLTRGWRASIACTPYART